MLLAIDPGTTESAYVIVDATLRPVEFQKISNGELLSRIEGAPDSRTRWSELTSCAIEMPEGIGMATGSEIFHTCRWVGQYQHAWRFSWDDATRWQDEARGRGEALELISRKRVKLHLLGKTSRLGRTADSAVRLALIAKHGGQDCIKAGGELHGVYGDCWAALAVAHTFLEAAAGTPPGQADAALKQNRILWNTGTDQLDESYRQARTRRGKTGVR
jgi:hypothetical protein